MGGFVMRMKIFAALGLVSALAVSSGAQAQDSGQMNWTAPYIGLSTGGEWGHQSRSTINTVTGVNVSNAASSSSGPMIGLLGGYDYMFANRIVLGALADVYATNITSDDTTTIGTNTSQARTKDHWLGTVQGRLGYAIGNWLPYASFGFGWKQGDVTRDQMTGTTGNAPPGTFEKLSRTNTGWTAGVGVDLALDNLIGLHNFVAGVAYRYASYSDSTLNFPLSQRQSTFTNNHSNTLLISLTYHFFSAPSAPPAMTPVAAPPAPPPAAMTPAKQMFIVFFEFDKSALTPDGKKVVDAAAAAFKSGKSNVAVAGYTDLAGTQQYNLALSKRRADTVKAALVKDGVPASAIGESWYGKQNPRVPTADGVREPQNRRVEITM
jgi:outer membrane protein OmpA-like peptidoglycan-associated protein